MALVYCFYHNIILPLPLTNFLFPQVKFLRSKRKQKQEQREQEAAKIIGLGERQKTIIATQTKVCNLFSIGFCLKRADKIFQHKEVKGCFIILDFCISYYFVKPISRLTEHHY